MVQGNSQVISREIVWVFYIQLHRTFAFSIRLGTDKAILSIECINIC